MLSSPCRNTIRALQLFLCWTTLLATPAAAQRDGLDCSRICSGCTQCGYSFGLQTSSYVSSNAASQLEQLTPSGDAAAVGTLSCEACDSSEQYQLVTGVDGTRYCGCMAGHGAVPTGSRTAALATAWTTTQLTRFACKACGPNQVPFQPDSNTRAAWNEGPGTWGVACMDPARGKQQQQQQPGGAGRNTEPTDDTAVSGDAHAPGGYSLPKTKPSAAAGSGKPGGTTIPLDTAARGGHSLPKAGIKAGTDAGSDKLAVSSDAAARGGYTMPQTPAAPKQQGAPPAAVSTEAGGRSSRGLRSGGFAELARAWQGSQGSSSTPPASSTSDEAVPPSEAAVAAAAAATSSTDAAQAWYQTGRRFKKQGGSSSSSSSQNDPQPSEFAPWLPGQCVDCSLVGGKADPTGTFCVCGKATAAANPYQDIPPGILYPSVPVPPIVGAPSGPAPIVGRSTEKRDRRRRLLAMAVTANYSAADSSLDSSLAGDEQAVTPQALCQSTGNPPYVPVTPSQTTCQLYINQLPVPGEEDQGFKECTATFINPNMVLTAAWCIVADAGQKYDIDPTNPGFMCCNYIPGTQGVCQPNAWFFIVRWVATRGYWNFPAGDFAHTNDGAVLLVEPGGPTTIQPVPIGISTFNKRPVPKLTLLGLGYARGLGNAVPPTTGEICFFDPLAGIFIPVCFPPNDPQICNPNNPLTFIRGCCDCVDVKFINLASICGSLTAGAETLYQWTGTQAPANAFFLPEQQGQLLQYIAPGCRGAYGGPLIHVFANSVFAILSASAGVCTSTIDGVAGLGLADYAQLVDRGQADGVWVGALASALIGQAPFGTGQPPGG